MILAEQNQSHNGGSGSAELNNPSSVQLRRENADDDPSRSTVAQLSSGYVNRVTSISSEDEEDTSSSSSSGSSVAADEDVAMDELGRRGWIDNQTLTSEANGIVLPGSDSIQIRKIHAINAPNLHIGQRVFIKSKGDLIIKSVKYSNAASPEDQKLPLENGSVHVEKHENGIGNLGSEAKVSKSADASNNPVHSTSTRGKVAEWLLSKRCLIAICIGALVLLLITVLCVWLTSSSDINNDNQIIVQRSEWGATQPHHAVQKLRVYPPEKIIIYHTVSQFCTTKRECSRIVRNIQDYHMNELDFNDICYNFLVGGDGRIYEGRGWGIVAAHTQGQNSVSIGIAFIGDYRFRSPTDQQVEAFKKLCDIGVQKKELAENYKILGHRQVAVTSSPGDKLFNVMTTWQHWSPEP